MRIRPYLTRLPADAVVLVAAAAAASAALARAGAVTTHALGKDDK